MKKASLEAKTLNAMEKMVAHSVKKEKERKQISTFSSSAARSHILPGLVRIGPVYSVNAQVT
jgi:hypothetical protein